MSANIQTSFKLVKDGFRKSFRKLDYVHINFMKLTEINIYPIKSLKGISLQESLVEKRGLAFDRRWMLVDENNKFLTQREMPKMATLEVEIEKNKVLFGQYLIAENFGEKVGINDKIEILELKKSTRAFVQ